MSQYAVVCPYGRIVPSSEQGETARLCHNMNESLKYCIKHMKLDTKAYYDELLTFLTFTFMKASKFLIRQSLQAYIEGEVSCF